MKKSLKILMMIIILSVITLPGMSLDLSEKAEISVITIGPYQPELYSAFGHSGIRVKDPENNIDWMYDYGRFDFNQKNFYWNFARGKMLYSIGRSKNFQRVIQYYKNEDRYILEQVLNFSREEKQALFDYLENNYLPENRNYLYNYVYDNCATRIRDAVVATAGGEIIFNDNFVEEDKSVRDLMDDYLEYQPWGDFIIDLGLGLQIDTEAPLEDYMFLPDYVYQSFDGGVIKKDSADVPLVKATNKLYKQKKAPEPVGGFTPFNFFILLFFVVGFITNRNFKKLKRSHWVDVILFSIVGVFGWWFVFLWFGTEHLSKYNWNLIWAFPLHLPFVFLLKKESFRPILARVYRFLAVLHLLTLVFWALIPQSLNQALLPLLVLLMLRSFYISYDLGRIHFKS